MNDQVISTAGPDAPSAAAEPEAAEVLVVDDEPAVAEFLLDCLALAGYRRQSAASPAEALELLRSRRFEVMLCDLVMPGMSGVELMVKARLEAPEMAILVVTAVSDIETAIRAMRLGAYDYLVKPVAPGDVVLRVASAMETRRRVLATRSTQERLQHSYSRLQEMSEVKDSLVQMLVHDLKTPLASAMGYMELLEKRDEGSFSERQLRYLQHAYMSCKDVLRMTATMLDVSRLERGALELRWGPLDLPALVRDSAAEAEPLVLASGGRIEAECREAAGQPFGDAELVRRVLANLLANAARHTPPGSRVQVRAGPGESGFALVSVADNGRGIPREDQERIFEKFCQLDKENRSGGAGIGLAFCRMAVAAHGGRIWVESEPGQGCTFHFTLPLKPPGGAGGSEDRITG